MSLQRESWKDRGLTNSGAWIMQDRENRLCLGF